MTHTDPSGPYGYDNDDHFGRALEAKHLAETSRKLDAISLADVLIGGEHEQWRVPFRAADYRSRVAALAYAAAVYEVEAVKVRARAEAVAR